MNWVEYQEKLDNLRLMDQNQNYFTDSSNQIGFPPQDEIGFKHHMITPADDGELITKNMRTANLDKFENIIIRKASIFLTFLESARMTFNMKDDQNLLELEDEVVKDINIILNVSVAKGGWLTDNILNPKRKFQLFGERAEKRGIFNRGDKQNA